MSSSNGDSFGAKDLSSVFPVCALGILLLQVLSGWSATFTVVNTNDTGPGSWRQAIHDANTNAGADLVEFNIPGPGPHTIQPLTILPSFTDPVTIDGYTQPGASPNTLTNGNNAVLLIELDGSQVTTVNAWGLGIASDHCTIRGLVINRFTNGSGHGIFVAGGGTNVIEGNFIGTDVTGTIDRGNSGHGVPINGSMGNLIGGATPAARNVISGNDGEGIGLNGEFGNNTRINIIAGNYVGTDKTGTAPLGNGGNGIISVYGASGNTIGLPAPGGGNIVAANGATGIAILGPADGGNVVQNNRVGTDVTGTLDFGNAQSGIYIFEVPDNLVGGTDANARNVFSGNQNEGIKIEGPAAQNNSVQGNYVGTDASGTAQLHNAFQGVWLGNTRSNVVGGVSPGAGNVISGEGNGVLIVGTNCSGNVIAGNLIGTDFSGTVALGHGSHAVRIADGFGNRIGGELPGEGNVIANGAGDGVFIQGIGARFNAILGNSISNNAGLGIDLAPNGTSFNDATDADSGPNDLQNFPVLTSAVTGTNTIVTGTLTSLANTTRLIQFFASGSHDPTGYGEGGRLVGTATVTIGVGGSQTFSVALAETVPIGKRITATATDPAGNTSEFSIAQPVLGATASPALYVQDFEGVVGPEWLADQVSITPVGARKYLGQFGNQTVTLSLPNVPPHTVAYLSFDLFIARSWDGNGPNSGPDHWRFGVDGMTSLDTTFAFQITLRNTRQSYPDNFAAQYLPTVGASEVNTLGYAYEFNQVSQPMDAVYRLQFAVAHTNENLVLDFSGYGLEALNNESWGLDNVRVELLDNPAGLLELSRPLLQVSENATNAILQVNRIGGSSGTVTVDYTTTNGNALAGMDYIATTGTLTFAPGETSKDIVIPVLNDSVAEATELLYLRLHSPGGGAALGRDQAQVAILSEDIPPGVIVYEGFDYAPGADLSGQAGGIGWLGGWTATGGDNSSASSLGYTDSLGNQLITSGNHAFYSAATVTNGDFRTFRDLPALRGADGTTTWISFLGQRVGPTTSDPANPFPRGVSLALHNDGSERLGIGNSTGASSNTWALIPMGTITNIQSSTAPFSELSLVVVRIDHKPGNDDAYLFVNPVLGAEPSLASAAAQSVGTFDLSFNRVRPFVGGTDLTNGRPYAELQLDEIRLGESYLSVTPFVNVTCPSNRVVECGSTWEFDLPVVTNSCDPNLNWVVMETTTNSHCGATISATRVWLALDTCGNSNTCSQTVTVVDTTPPILTCASNRTVECSVAWEFDPPTVADACDPNAAFSIVGTTTNALCGVSYGATRIWLAVDACGNSNLCSQTVTVVDTTLPAITCSSNITVECTGGGGATVSFSVQAADICDSNVQIVSTPPSGSFFNLGTTVVTSIAVDACGNSNTCTFTVTVRDTIPPTIACPTNIIAAEFPFDSGGAMVNFAPPVVSDICESSLSLTVTPPSGSVFPVGTNTVTCVVADSSGNSNVCSFAIRVIPYRLFVTTNVTTTADSGPGSLRQALLDANDSPGENLVLFNITGPGPHIITLESALPEVTSPVIINGWSQPGFNGLPLVTVTGAGLSNAADGLVLHAGNSTVRGLVLNGFATGIKLLAGNTVVQGNFIGTDSSGVVAAPNSGDGIYVTSGRNLIGGTTNWAPNIISANGGSGIHFEGAGATNNLVRGNYIGVGADFVTALGNGADGVRFEDGAARNSIGGPVINSANGIANNASNGVALLPTAGLGNGIYANSIFDNGALGIDLNADGVTPNDAGDADAGPNGLLNHPVVTDARSATGGLQIDGTYTGNGNATYRLDFYLSNTADPSGSGEGRTHLGHILFEVFGSGPEFFAATFPVTAVYTQQLTATATDFADNTSEFSPAVTVRTPPVLETQPESTNTPPGGTVLLCASASGTPPIYFQWRLNGVNIPDATNQCFEIPSAEVTNGGSYSVVIHNALGASLTVPAGVEVEVTNAVPGADDFADAAVLTGLGGETAWSNRDATREPGEPLHANKPGHHSIWYQWTAPEKGVLTIGLRGSDFDTMLGVYRGTNVASLYTEAGDEDRGGFYTSSVRFNAIKSRKYHFAVDGLGDEAGRFFFGWQLEETPHLLPAILAQPQSLTVAPGRNATFSVGAARVCGNGFTNCITPLHFGSPEDPEPTELPNLDCQWLFNGVPIPGETNFTLTISNVQPANLGLYRARIFTPWQTLESADADLAINLTGDTTQPVQSADKLLDVLLLVPWIIGDLLPPTTPPAGGANRDTVVRGYTGTQIFNTAGSATGVADEPICGVLGGASEYITFVPAESGVLFVNTDGSTYDTVMAVFLRNPTNASQLLYLNCDNNGGMDGSDSSLNVPVVAGQTNVVLVDGVGGAFGILQLNYSLLSSISLRGLGATLEGNLMQVLSRTNANFTLQRSSNMIHWASILTTNSPSGVFNHTDPTPPGSVRFFYRAQLLP